MGAVAIQPFNGRDVLRCCACELVQFPTRAGVCRKCREPYEKTDELVSSPAPRRAVSSLLYHDVGLAMAAVRAWRRLSQSDVARRMRTSRTYVAKLERGLIPQTKTFLRIAKALRVSPYLLLAIADFDREDACRKN